MKTILEAFLSVFEHSAIIINVDVNYVFDNKQLWLALHTYVSSLPRDSSETFRLTRQTSRLKSRLFIVKFLHFFFFFKLCVTIGNKLLIKAQNNNKYDI